MNLHKLLICRELLDDEIISGIDAILVDKNQDCGKLASLLLAKAEALGLSGNVIKAYVIYLLAHKTTPLTLAIENARGQVGKSLIKAFYQDMKIIDELLNLKPSVLLDCTLLDDYEPTKANESIAFKYLLQNLNSVNDSDAKAEVFMEYYKIYGCGDMADYRAFFWDDEKMQLAGIQYFETMKLDDLIGYEYQKEMLLSNTKAFVDNKPANNVLLVGARGTGKSSGVKAVVNDFFDAGLRLVQLTKEQLIYLPKIMQNLRDFSTKKFIIFLDDLSFEEFEVEYKYLKSAIEGGASAKPDNVLIYATSNRRHLIKESYKDRGANDDDMHRTDTLNETISLSDRFGLILYYLAPNQQEYLDIVKALLAQNGIFLNDEELRIKASAWEKEHSGRSGRVAQQFVTHYLGQLAE